MNGYKALKYGLQLLLVICTYAVVRYFMTTDTFSWGWITFFGFIAMALLGHYLNIIDELEFKIFCSEHGLNGMKGEQAAEYITGLLSNKRVSDKKRQRLAKFLQHVRSKWYLINHEEIQLCIPDTHEWEHDVENTDGNIIRHIYSNFEESEHDDAVVIYISSTDIGNVILTPAQRARKCYTVQYLEGDMQQGETLTLVADGPIGNSRYHAYAMEMPDNPISYNHPEDMKYAYSILYYILDTSWSRHVVHIEFNTPRIGVNRLQEWMDRCQQAHLVPTGQRV
ncbi:hypothetical protein [Parapedobacter tibetensis]|uniref:hypothetical protein n=1 Tax=Parapedobacter tibetensis TaxID=2972951 RepID=UPI00214DA956|nr:hypothetical protein [Parapedobacter tibetensis]